MTNSRLYSSIVLILGLASSNGIAGTWTFTNLSGDDLETGIDPSKTYTHLVDLGPETTGATINGVTFKDKALTGANYSLQGPGTPYPNNTPPATLIDTGVGDLLSDFQYGIAADGFQTLTLTGLREAHTYRLSFFVAAWGNPASDISASDAPGVTNRIARDGTRIVRDLADPENWETTDAGAPAALINYEYVAPADGTLVMKLDPVSNADTFHQYGFMNELIGIPGDSDNDGMPDIYEQANGLNPAVNDSQLDLDNDGVLNLAEYQKDTLANNPDTDGDGLKDGVETNSGTFANATDTGTNPANPDTDGDGLTDGVETNSGAFADAEHTGTSPLKADGDADGFNDGFEVQHASDPNVATSTPESTLDIRTAIEFRFNAASNVSYRIEGSADLTKWETIEGTINGTGAVVTRFYSTENTPLRFYRIQRN